MDQGWLLCRLNIDLLFVIEYKPVHTHNIWKSYLHTFISKLVSETHPHTTVPAVHPSLSLLSWWMPWAFLNQLQSQHCLRYKPGLFSVDVTLVVTSQQPAGPKAIPSCDVPCPQSCILPALQPRGNKLTALEINYNQYVMEVKNTHPYTLNALGACCCLWCPGSPWGPHY